MATPQPDAPRALSRLELAVLSLVARGGPCTAHWIRQQFLASPSSHFSGSAGAVYPAVRRLEQRGLARSDTRRDGARESRRYRVTGDGETALRDWLLLPLPAEDVAYSADPVRTRVYSLGVLAPAERLRFVDDALVQTRRHASVVAADCERLQQADDAYQYLGARGVLHEVRAKIRWLEELRRTLSERPSANRS